MSHFSLEKRYPSHFAPLEIGKTLHDTLQEFIDIDVTADDLIAILNHNQAYKNYFSAFMQQRIGKNDEKEGGNKEKQLPTHRLIGLMGMLGSRNLIIALRFYKILHKKFPSTKEEFTEFKPGELLKRSLEVEDLFSRNKLEYSETAFAASTYFDLFHLLADKLGVLKKIDAFFTDTWKKSQRSALIAYHLAEKIPGVPVKQAIAGSILSHVGKIHMMMDFPDGKSSYSEYCERIKKDNLTYPAQLIHEREKFGVIAEELGAFSLFSFDIFQNLYRPVRYYREPYCLKGFDTNNYRLASMLNLTESMAQAWKIPADEKDPVFQQWSYPWTKSLKIKAHDLIDVMKKSMQMR